MPPPQAATSAAIRNTLTTASTATQSTTPSALISQAVKLTLDAPVIGYLSYPGFDREPHPALASSLRVDLRTFRVRFDDFTQRENPPILHRKELFVADGYPGREKFARLTAQEERWGLLREAHVIGTRSKWGDRLREEGVALRGHRVVRASGS